VESREFYPRHFLWLLRLGYRHEGNPNFKYLLALDDEMAECVKKSESYPNERATSEKVHLVEERPARTVALRSSITSN
jgi:hypothetical protein